MRFLAFLRCVRLGNPDLDFQNLNPDFDFDWEIRKRFRKTILVNGGLLFAKYACAFKTAVLKDSFSNPFPDFPIER